MKTLCIFFTAVAIAVLVLALLGFIAKLYIFCAMTIKGESATVKFGGDFTTIFICVLIIALYFLLY